MRRSSLLALLPVVFAAAMACGDDASPIVESKDAGPPTVAPFGLDVRPVNATCKPPARPQFDTDVTFEPAFGATTFAAPIALRMAPGDASTFYVVERSGNIIAIKRGETTKRTFFSFPSGVVNAAGEGGFLAFAFHPSWPATPEAFLSYTTFSTESAVNMRSVVARVKSSDGGQTLDPATIEEVFTLKQPFTNHNGGDLSFGPDGFLYFGLGDGGSGGDPLKAGQDKNNLLGKMLRFDVSGEEGGKKYKIPATNPFAGGGGAPEIYALGFRNPWRWSFDKQSGDLWVADVGQSAYEEVDLVKLGGNYGWSAREGRHCFEPKTNCATTGLIDPIAEHPRSEAQSITGGYVYRGTAIPSLVGKFIYGDYPTGNVWAVQDEGGGQGVPLRLGNVGASSGLASFGQDADGEVYALFIAKGTINMLKPAKPPAASTFPDRLSKTGCVDPSDPKRPAAGLIAYEPNSPLWSDGATKERFMAVPDSERIKVNAEGDWEYPIGTVFMKTFFLDGKRVETRLFMYHDDAVWAGYSYEWNDEQTDATLLTGSKTKTIGKHEWLYPSGVQCMQCHTERAGWSLGLETAQLNRDFVYASTNRLSNQLKTLEHIDMFERPFSGAAPETLPKFPEPLSTQGTLEERAKAYLHANCSNCHRPPSGRTQIDLRFSTPLAAAKMCDVPSQIEDFGLAESAILKPGAPENSILSLRVHALDARRMPALASKIVDDKGVAVVDAWIRSVATCPK